MKETTKQIGDFGEDIAEKHLKKRFWRIISRNFKAHGGEIDIIERLNSDDFVYQTVHSGWTAKNPNNPPKGGRGRINPTGWNIYALEWTSEKIVWKVNGVETHSYARVGDDPARYPWTEPFYLMIDMQLGGSWVGDVDESTLPCKMYVDWVKYYGAFQDGKKISISKKGL